MSHVARPRDMQMDLIAHVEGVVFSQGPTGFVVPSGKW